MQEFLSLFLCATDQEKLNKWFCDHKCVYYGRPDSYAGAIGGNFTYEVTPTSLGDIFKVSCGCGQEIDLTDYESW